MTRSLSIAAMTGLTLVAPAAGHVQANAVTVLVRLTDSRALVTPSKVPVGRVIFKIANRGTAARSFTIAGRRTTAIAAGRSATLTVDLKGRGPREYVSSGRHAARLAGVLTVFVPCSSPKVTTVNVRMDHDRSGITLSQTKIPCGTVTFVVTNIGAAVDSFQVFTDYPNASGTTPDLEPGQTARLTIHFTEKSVAFYQSGEYIPGEPEFGGGDADGGSVSIV
jgi:hypothetical protein